MTVYKTTNSTKHSLDFSGQKYHTNWYRLTDKKKQTRKLIEHTVNVLFLWIDCTIVPKFCLVLAHVIFSLKYTYRHAGCVEFRKLVLHLVEQYALVNGLYISERIRIAEPKFILVLLEFST